MLPGNVCANSRRIAFDESLHWAPERLGEACQKMIDEHGKIVRTLAGAAAAALGSHSSDKKKVLAEAAGGYFRFEIPIGRCDDAHVDGN